MNSLQKTLLWFSSRSLIQIVLMGLAVAGGIIILARFQQQLGAFLPYLILLLCPVMHVFMHRGHGGGKAGDGHDHGTNESH